MSYIHGRIVIHFVRCNSFEVSVVVEFEVLFFSCASANWSLNERYSLVLDDNDIVGINTEIFVRIIGSSGVVFYIGNGFT